MTEEEAISDDTLGEDEFESEISPWDEPMHDPEPVDVALESGTTEEIVLTVDLPSGRDWVKYILDLEVYRKAHKDLQEAFGDDWDAYVDHFLNTGVYEGRTKGVLFDPFAYADAYPDVKEECGDDAKKIIEHYVTYGINESRPIGTTQGYEDIEDKANREQMVGEPILHYWKL